MSNLIVFLRDRLFRNRWNGLTPRLRKQLLTVSGTTGVILLLWLAVLPSREDLNAFQPREIGRTLQFIRGSVNGTVSLEPYELGLMSLFTRLRGRTLPPDNIVLLAIDDESLNIADNVFPEELEETPILKAMNTWPWPRRVHARAVELLMDAGAKAVIFDVVFSTPSSYGPRDDLSFADILATYGDRVALAAIYPDPTVRGGSIHRVRLPVPSLLEAGARVGYVNLPLEDNGAVYQLYSKFDPPAHSPLFGISRDDPSANSPLAGLEELPSLAEAGLAASGTEVPQQVGDWVYFYGGSGSLPTVSYSQLLVPALREHNLDEDTFRDKVVLIGATAVVLQDFHFTPWGRMPGPEIVLTNLANLQEKRWLRTLPWQLQLFAIVGVGLGGGWWVSRPTNTQFIVLRTLVATTAWVGLSYILFLSGWAITVTVWAGAALFFSGILDSVNSAIADRLNRLRLRSTLERYVSAPVAAEIIASQQKDLQTLLKGKSLKVSLLFSDIRGFTTISSQLPPEMLVPQLNRYLGAMVEAITHHQGCVDKFIGDAVMAEFGSPISAGYKQDAMNAIRAALDMRAVLSTLRQEWKQVGKPLMFNGIGINFGEVVVGNIGSPQRLEYTAIGDTVNVASRVESLTKDFKTDLIVTQSVYELVQDEIEVNPLGTRQLRGRSSETALFEVIGLKGQGRELFDRVKADFAAHTACKESRGESYGSVANAGIDIGVEDIQQQADGDHNGSEEHH
ncbi:MAG: CHASE2 domain-containing protein [Synechococcus sp.]